MDMLAEAERVQRQLVCRPRSVLGEAAVDRGQERLRLEHVLQALQVARQVLVFVERERNVAALQRDLLAPGARRAVRHQEVHLFLGLQADFVPEHGDVRLLEVRHQRLSQVPNLLDALEVGFGDDTRVDLLLHESAPARRVEHTVCFRAPFMAEDKHALVGLVAHVEDRMDKLQLARDLGVAAEHVVRRVPILVDDQTFCTDLVHVTEVEPGEQILQLFEDLALAQAELRRGAARLTHKDPLEDAAVVALVELAREVLHADELRRLTPQPRLSLLPASLSAVLLQWRSFAASRGHLGKHRF